MNSIYHRRSIRRYTDEPIKDEQIQEILRAGMAAPSAVNGQPWEFYVVKNQKLKEKLAKVSPYAKSAALAPVVLAPVYHTDCTAPEYAQIDMGICIENMMLRADELGLGSVCLGIAPIEDRMDKVKALLNLPEKVECFALLPVGYSAEEPVSKETWDPKRIHILD